MKTSLVLISLALATAAMASTPSSPNPGSSGSQVAKKSKVTSPGPATILTRSENRPLAPDECALPLNGETMKTECCPHDKVERPRCVSPLEALLTEGAYAMPPSGSRDTGTCRPFEFWPTGGILHRDLFTSNYVDLDGSAAVQAFECTDFSYDGHKGNDTIVRSFSEQIAGVPIFAVADGVVLDANDGEDDQNTTWAGQAANYVVLEHPCGRVTKYWHLRKNSVEVATGDSVVKGEQIGLMGSSGISTWPHLHFQVEEDGTHVEPYMGACGPANSMWEDQPGVNYNNYISDAAFCVEDLATAPNLPWPQPRTGHFSADDETIYIWMLVHNLPANSTRDWTFIKPDGSIAATAGPFEFNNGTNWGTQYGQYWFDIDAIPGLANTLGTWRVQFRINGILKMDLPFDMVADRGDIWNRKPQPIGGWLVPAEPEAQNAIVANVSTNLLGDDKDYDMVKYRYMWYVNDVLVRDVTSAGQSDILARDKAESGDEVLCCIIPQDGKEYGDDWYCLDATVALAGDANGDLLVNIGDLLLVINMWGPCPDPFRPCGADLNEDLRVDVQDLLLVIGDWSRG
ncbi:MAG: peptidoglycan DD-metalloendopeptidase family protein [Phycisphaerales bacterium]|nr:peptidoglycan DD-metalloendopeptidase family protein [Phycisphaerales bacterium]